MNVKVKPKLKPKLKPRPKPKPKIRLEKARSSGGRDKSRLVSRDRKGRPSLRGLVVGGKESGRGQGSKAGQTNPVDLQGRGSARRRRPGIDKDRKRGAATVAGRGRSDVGAPPKGRRGDRRSEPEWLDTFRDASKRRSDQPTNRRPVLRWSGEGTSPDRPARDDPSKPFITLTDKLRKEARSDSRGAIRPRKHAVVEQHAIFAQARSTKGDTGSREKHRATDRETTKDSRQDSSDRTRDPNDLSVPEIEERLRALRPGDDIRPSFVVKKLWQEKKRESDLVANRTDERAPRLSARDTRTLRQERDLRYEYFLTRAREQKSPAARKEFVAAILKDMQESIERNPELRGKVRIHTQSVSRKDTNFFGDFPVDREVLNPEWKTWQDNLRRDREMRALEGQGIMDRHREPPPKYIKKEDRASVLLLRINWKDSELSNDPRPQDKSTFERVLDKIGTVSGFVLDIASLASGTFLLRYGVRQGIRWVARRSVRSLGDDVAKGLGYKTAKDAADDAARALGDKAAKRGADDAARATAPSAAKASGDAARATAPSAAKASGDAVKAVKSPDLGASARAVKPAEAKAGLTSDKVGKPAMAKSQKTEAKAALTSDKVGTPAKAAPKPGAKVKDDIPKEGGPGASTAEPGEQVWVNTSAKSRRYHPEGSPQWSKVEANSSRGSHWKKMSRDEAVQREFVEAKSGLAAARRGTQEHAMVAKAMRPHEGKLHSGGWRLEKVERTVGGKKRVDELWINDAQRKVFVADTYTGRIESAKHLAKGWKYSKEPGIMKYLKKGYKYDYSVAIKHPDHLH